MISFARFGLPAGRVFFCFMGYAHRPVNRSPVSGKDITRRSQNKKPAFSG
jgi:hypothetical protein